MSTAWEETIWMMKNHHTITESRETEFRALKPEAVIEFMKANPGQKTIPELVVGLNSTRATIRRIMIYLEEIGRIKIDRARIKNNYLYFLSGE